MKKSLLALAALSAFAGGAMAQSSVTLFGIVDLNGRNVKNNGVDAYSMSTDGNASSRLGFRGVEDLGGGLRAGFWLEAGLAADNGTIGGGNGGATANASSTTFDASKCTVDTTTANSKAKITCPTNAASAGASGGAFFNRRATVSVLGGFGEIRLGRDYVPTFWNHTVFDVFGTNGVAQSTNLMAAPGGVAPFGSGTNGGSALSAGTLVRANNSIGYFLPSLGGLYGQVMVTAGEKQIPGNKYFGGRIGYGAGPFNVAVAYGETNQEDAGLGKLKASNIGGSWNAGFLTVMGQYNHYTQEESAAAVGRTLDNYSIGVAVPLGAGTIKASYGETKFKISGTAPKATQFGVGYVYDLSKRTALYVHAAQVDNDNGLAYTAGTGGPSAGTATGFKSTGYEFGVRHSF